jgi:hypothetical protein
LVIVYTSCGFLTYDSQLANRSTIGQWYYADPIKEFPMAVGYSEDLVGEALQVLYEKYGYKREDLFVQTK